MAPHGGGGGGRDKHRGHRPLLEMTVISAQDIHQWSRKVEAYATAWIDPAQKLRTQVDRTGRTDPTWNDKFVFRVDGAFLYSDTSAITVAIHAARGRLSVREDPVLGIARIHVSTFVRPSYTSPSNRQVLALQVRRPRSLRPQGILNVAVGVVDNYAHSMPLYYAPGSPNAFALKDLMTRPKSMTKIHEELEVAFMDQQARTNAADHSGPLETTGSSELKERKALESKLEQWKTELSPEEEEEEADRPNNKRRRRQDVKGRRSGCCCFCSGAYREQ